MIKPTADSSLARADLKHGGLPARIGGHARPDDVAIRLARHFRYKYSLERVIAFFLLIPALPIIFLLCLLVRLTSRGPAIYRQTRVGLNGRDFEMLKIRTMSVDAEAGTGPQWCSRSDPRITPVGRWLRLLHLDELPQLINVVMGDMAIIGPRPERPDFVKILNQQVENYSDRLAVKPGITGLAQIYLPPDETIDCVHRKVCFDRAYIKTATPIVDLQIWMCTIVRIFGIRQGRGPRWFGLDRRYSEVRKTCMSSAAPVGKPKKKPRASRFRTPPVAEPVVAHNLHDSSHIDIEEFPENPIQNHVPRQPR